MMMMRAETVAAPRQTGNDALISFASLHAALVCIAEQFLLRCVEGPATRNEPAVTDDDMKRPIRVFDQDDIRVMATALDGAWNYLRCRESELSHPDVAETTRHMLAKRIIAAARSERRRHGELLMSALYGVVRNIEFDPDNSFHRSRIRPSRFRSGL
jgi:hypothetical protein